ncbi:uncharacterized protein LOC120348167 [Styela clava]
MSGDKRVQTIPKDSQQETQNPNQPQLSSGLEHLQKELSQQAHSKLESTEQKQKIPQSQEKQSTSSSTQGAALTQPQSQQVESSKSTHKTVISKITEAKVQTKLTSAQEQTRSRISEPVKDEKALLRQQLSEKTVHQALPPSTATQAAKPKLEHKQPKQLEATEHQQTVVKIPICTSSGDKISTPATKSKDQPLLKKQLQDKSLKSKDKSLLKPLIKEIQKQTSNMGEDPGKGESGKSDSKGKKALHRMIKITNPDDMDHDELMKRLRVRFKKKTAKWEGKIIFYSRCAFMMTFALLLLQVLQMLIQPLRGEWISDRVVTILQNVLIALTALVAGLQLKLKMSEKADKYRKGVKIYYHLMRMTSYYIMMTESGGRPEYKNTISFWKDALKKEMESIPVLQAFKQ